MGVRGREWVAAELNGALTAPKAVLLLLLVPHKICLFIAEWMPVVQSQSERRGKLRNKRKK